MVAGGRRLESRAGEKGGSATGPSPVDRARLGSKHHLLVDATGIPLSWSLTGGNRNDVSQLIPLLEAVPAVTGVRGRPRRRELEAAEGEDGMAPASWARAHSRARDALVEAERAWAEAAPHAGREITVEHVFERIEEQDVLGTVAERWEPRDVIAARGWLKAQLGGSVVVAPGRGSVQGAGGARRVGAGLFPALVLWGASGYSGGGRRKP